MNNSQQKTKIEKADQSDLIGRFREIISDPLNLLIERDWNSGIVEDGRVTLHNGIKVPVQGNESYYEEFSQILILNRGVHEPLEEYVFQKLLPKLPNNPVMIEMGAYWAHYSMWLKKKKPGARTICLESDPANLEVGRNNFKRNGMESEFQLAFISKLKFSLDNFLLEKSINTLHILHSDIQGFEIEMLEGSQKSFQSKTVDYVFVSTHSQAIHSSVVDFLQSHGYRVEVSSDFENQSTSYDGFIFSSSPNVVALFDDFEPLGRIQITEAMTNDILQYLNRAQ